MSYTPNFNDWFFSKVKVSPALKSPHIVLAEFVINVSDEFYEDTLNTFHGVPNYFWFPMGESTKGSTKDMGLSSLFGAMKIMHMAFLKNQSVLIHCHAGKNRSVMVKDCFYYMMNNRHLPEEGNKLIENCERQNMPNILFMELWLRRCRYAFDNPQKFFGGFYDYTIRKATTFYELLKRSDLNPSIHSKEVQQRTKERLIQILELGLVDLGFGQFGKPNVVSGLYIEMIWNLPQHSWDEYIEFVIELLEKK